MSSPEYIADDYVGRFAPSPTGPLHFGSLVAALASWLDARAAGGHWLLRIEDIDPPREQPGAAASIIRSLEAHHLFWDGEIAYQSARLAAYAEQLAQWKSEGLLYPCRCTRAEIAAVGGIYQGHCRRHPPPADAEVAWRLRIDGLPTGTMAFEDIFQGQQTEDDALREDFIVLRKDGLYAYQLAVVIDDVAAGINHCIRGSDLLPTTARQLCVYGALGAHPPRYGHVPVALDSKGNKLSKQTHAKALDNRDARDNLCAALAFLGYAIDDEVANLAAPALLEWAIRHWCRQRVPQGSAQAAPVKFTDSSF